MGQTRLGWGQADERICARLDPLTSWVKPAPKAGRARSIRTSRVAILPSLFRKLEWDGIILIPPRFPPPPSASDFCPARFCPTCGT